MIKHNAGAEEDGHALCADKTISLYSNTYLKSRVRKSYTMYTKYLWCNDTVLKGQSAVYEAVQVFLQHT